MRGWSRCSLLCSLLCNAGNADQPRSWVPDILGNRMSTWVPSVGAQSAFGPATLAPLALAFDVTEFNLMWFSLSRVSWLPRPLKWNQEIKISKYQRGSHTATRVAALSTYISLNHVECHIHEKPWKLGDIEYIFHTGQLEVVLAYKCVSHIRPYRQVGSLISWQVPQSLSREFAIPSNSLEPHFIPVLVDASIVNPWD